MTGLIIGPKISVLGYLGGPDGDHKGPSNVTESVSKWCWEPGTSEVGRWEGEEDVLHRAAGGHPCDLWVPAGFTRGQFTSPGSDPGNSCTRVSSWVVKSLGPSAKVGPFHSTSRVAKDSSWF